MDLTPRNHAIINVCWVVSCAGIMRSMYPAFSPGTSEVAAGFLVFSVLVLRICPNCLCMQLFLVLYSFFIFCCWRRRLFKCEHCSKGSQIPGPGLSHFHTITKKSKTQEIFNMAEEADVEITFLPTNTSKLQLHVEQLLQNTH